MLASEAQAQMVRLEQHAQEFTVEQFLAWLLNFSDQDAETVGQIAGQETERALEMARNNYIRLTTQPDEEVIAGVAFLQGATFAAAALGKEPYASQS